MSKKILVTGGCGFIGCNFIRYILRNTYHEVINIDKLTYAGSLYNINDFNKESHTFIHGDICDDKLIDKLMQKRIDCVVNFAAESHVDRSIENSTPFFKSNVLGTQVLLEAAKKWQVKQFIQISTDEVYGSIKQGVFSENSPLLPNSPYAASKASADLLCRSYHKTYGMPIIITRTCNNFGPYQHSEKLIPSFILKALKKQKLPVYGDGMNMREWIYVVDNCDAIFKIMNNGIPGEIYNIGSGHECTNLDMTYTIIDLLNEKENLIEFVDDRLGHDYRYALDSSKVRALGWKPKHEFIDALRETVNWYRNLTGGEDEGEVE